MAGVVELLSLRGIDADCRGHGAATFVYAAKDRRAIEISRDEVGVFIEMFEQPSEISIRDEQQDTFDIGAQSAIEWRERTNEEIEQAVGCKRRQSPSFKFRLATIGASTLTLAKMKSNTKRVIGFFLGAFVIIIISGAIWLSMPYAKIRDLDTRYASLSKGMHRNDVINAMGKSDYRSVKGAAAWWDDEPLGPDEDARVGSAIRYTVNTFFLPVSFEFTFDEAGNLVGRHRFD